MRTESSWPFRAFLLASFALLAACGGGGGGSNGGNGGGGGGSGGNRAPVAAVGGIVTVSAGNRVLLDGSASSDPDGDILSFEWRQVHGPDVTGSSSALASVAPEIVAPDEVSTLVFELRVSDGRLSSAPSAHTVLVLEDRDRAIFVDGDRGADADGRGTHNAPFATIKFALAGAATEGSDIYVASRTADRDALAYRPVGPVLVPAGVSLYGGYTSDWRRDVTGNRTRLWTDNGIGVFFQDVDQPAVLSGFDIQTGLAENPRERGPLAVYVEKGAGDLRILDNTLAASLRLAQASDGRNPNYGVFLSNLRSVEIRRNTIVSGDMDRVFPEHDDELSIDGRPGANGVDSGDPEIPDGGAGGVSPWLDANGGDGGDGHLFVFLPMRGEGGEDGEGPAGGAGGEPDFGIATSGDDGGDGANGAGGQGGIGNAVVDATELSAAGGYGIDGQHGSGGGGGAGGASSTFGEGAGGGGGGSGGEGGLGGVGGSGGSGSIGLLVMNVSGAVVIDSNLIHAGSGSRGGAGGAGGQGGDGGYGGYGANGNGGQPGKDGGNGGAGGAGGHGGGGGGGASIGIVIGAGIAAEISNNEITTSDGGDGGAGGNGGEGGYSIGIVDADLDDGVAPVLVNNTFVLGEPGAGGAGTVRPGAPGKAQQLGWE